MEKKKDAFFTLVDFLIAGLAAHSTILLLQSSGDLFPFIHILFTCIYFGFLHHRRKTAETNAYDRGRNDGLKDALDTMGKAIF